MTTRTPIHTTLPIRPSERLAEVDVLRGFAVFGMIIWDFRSRSFGVFHIGNGADYSICTFIDYLHFSETIHLIFAFLFGWGLAMQLARSNGAQGLFSGIYIKRLMWLFIIGLMQQLLWYPFDFILQLAVLGLVLPLFFGRSDKVIIGAALIFIGSPVFLHYLLLGFIPSELFNSPDLKLHFITQPSYRVALLSQVSYFLKWYSHIESYTSVFDMTGSLLLGLYVARKRVFQNIKAHYGLIWSVCWVSLLVSLLGWGWSDVLRQWAINPDAHGAGSALPYEVSLYFGKRAWILVPLTNLYTSHTFALFYISAITLLCQSMTYHRILRPFADLGRMALTNYLLHNLIGTVLFYGYGFALYNLGCTTREGIALFVVGLQILASSLWLARYTFGPMEWIWRRATYGRALPNG